MKQEEEPWIDHLKQRVNEYEKPLPGNDWNHFQNIKHPHLLYPYRHTSQEALQAAFPLCLKTNCYRTGPNQRQLP